MKNKIIIFIILLFDMTCGFSQNNVGIGTISPDSNAILEMQATDKGMLIPRMTSNDRNSMSPSLGLNQKGLMVFDNDSTKFFYWNGYSWQTFGSGAMGPQGPPGIVPTRHWVGEHFQGGIIFWVDTSGQHGLIVDPIDLSMGMTWSNILTTSVGPSAQSLTDGLSNSIAIVAQPGHTVSAASICLAYNGGGYTDWYLPSIKELQILVINCYDVQGAIFNSYWSSTEMSLGEAYYGCINMLCTGLSKASFHNVRAIRKF
jgi:hypothetical protein